MHWFALTPVLPQPLGPTLFPGTEVRIITATIDTAAAMVMVVIDPAIIHATTTIIPEVPITVWDLGDITTAIAPTPGPPDIVITDHTTMALVATLRYQTILTTGITHSIPGNSVECGIPIHPVTALRMASALVVAMLHC